MTDMNSWNFSCRWIPRCHILSHWCKQLWKERWVWANSCKSKEKKRFWLQSVNNYILMWWSNQGGVMNQMRLLFTLMWRPELQVKSFTHSVCVLKCAHAVNRSACSSFNKLLWFDLLIWSQDVSRVRICFMWLLLSAVCEVLRVSITRKLRCLLMCSSL